MQGNVTVKKIVAVNSYELSPDFNLEAHTHEDYELFFVDNGIVSFYYEGSTPFTLHSGELLLHRPNIPHGTVCDGKHSAAFFNIIFRSTSPALNLLTGRSIKIPDGLLDLARAITAEAESAYELSVQPIVKKPDATFGADALLVRYLEILFIHLVRAMDSGKRSRSRLRDGESVPADELYRYLADSIYERVTLDAICERFHFGKTHLSVGFRKKFGISIMDCYLDMKINEAKRLLREEKASVKEISERLAFDSPEYFSRCFKKRVGYTPRAYRGMLIMGTKLKR